MSMRILFADDSMTAQNMGKKILTEAGYEVVAVSNGAAAVKKIAEQKPDIIILDIYMPGYSGLEVCDKVRASAETLRTPVLLTVGKMEPYRAEDANRVRADGVIIKPFEASDLLAVVKKLEERVVPKTVAMAEDTILLEKPPEFSEFPPAASDHTETHADRGGSTVQATVDVPDNMATTAAFSDFLGVEPAPAPIPTAEPSPAAEFSVSQEYAVEPPAGPVEFASLSAEKVTDAVSASAETVSHHEAEAPAAQSSTSVSEPAPAAATHFVPEITTPSEAEEIVASERESHAENAAVAAASSMPTAVVVSGAGTPEVHKPASEPEHAVVFAAATMAAPEPSPSPSFIDPGMTVDAGGFESFSAKVESEIQKIESIVSASEARHAEVKPVENGFAHHDLPTEVSVDEDFEARVAAAMSIYDEPVEERAEATATVVDEPKPVADRVEVASAPTPESWEATHSFVYSPPVSAPEPLTASEPEVVNESTEPVVEAAQHSIQPASVEPEVETTKPEPVERYATLREDFPNASEQQIPTQPEPSRVDDEKIISEIEAQLPVAAVANAADPSQTQVIADVIHRVLERLKPQLIEEISRELKSKK